MVFKILEENDTILETRHDALYPCFDTDVVLKKTGTGWTAVKNASFTESGTITASVYFVNNNSFYITYANEADPSNYAQYLGWNSIMSTIGAPYNAETQQYDYFIGTDRITEVVAISINPDLLQDGIDFDNFFVVLSQSTTDTGFTDKAGTTYNVGTHLVLAPYYIKETHDDLLDRNSGESQHLSPAIELRSSSSASFLVFDETADSINIDWTQGTITGVQGMLYPEHGLILLFPANFTIAGVQTSVRTGDRSLGALRSLMVLGGYVKEEVDRRIFFARLYNKEYNISTNPTTFIIEDGQVRRNLDLELDPTTYITQVGFYNDQNECLAVGFMSTPMKKDRFTERNVRSIVED